MLLPASCVTIGITFHLLLTLNVVADFGICCSCRGLLLASNVIDDAGGPGFLLMPGVIDDVGGFF